MRRGNVLPIKGLIYKTLGLINLLPAEGGGNGNT